MPKPVLPPLPHVLVNVKIQDLSTGLIHTVKSFIGIPFSPNQKNVPLRQELFVKGEGVFVPVKKDYWRDPQTQSLYIYVGLA